ncbi:MAG: hypothetical protein ABF289_01710 [Clostridiales bacterium]
MIKKNYIKGSISIESAILLPLISMAIFIFIILIEVFNIHIEMQKTVNYMANSVLERNYNLYNLDKELELVLIDGGYKKYKKTSYRDYISSISEIDFTNSIISEKNGIIDIKLRYQIDTFILGKILPSIVFNHRAYIKTELEGRKNKYIWNQNHIKRGLELQYKFGKNVLRPVNGEFFKFDVLTGEAIEMRTIDPTLKTYKKPGEIIKSVEKNIIKFNNYNEEIYIYVKGKIKKYNIKSKKFLLVIPEDTINSQNKKEISEIEKIAYDYKMDFELIEFGVKAK